MNTAELIIKLKNFTVKIVAVLLAPLALLVYLPGYETDFYYIGSFDAVWKYPVKNIPASYYDMSDQLNLTDVSFLMKDTSLPLHAPDYIREKDYQIIKNNIIVRWKNTLYKKNKNELSVLNTNHFDSAAGKIIPLLPDTLNEAKKITILESRNHQAGINRNLPVPTDRSKMLTRAHRDDINRMVFKLLNKENNISYRFRVYAWTFFVLLILMIYLRNFHPEIYSDDKKVAFIYFMMSVSVWGVMFFHKWNLMLFAFPFLMFPMVILVFFDARISGIFILVQSFIHFWYFPDKAEFLTVVLLSSLAVNFAFRSVDERKKLTYASVLYIVLSSFFYVLFHLITSKTRHRIA